ncbi:CDP-alcohol phosphatidyltransferase family protein [Frisingicoccus sp.]|uniref:CDP-alcohol phosphatidyltransferase family protein n=1 Tax=Frisingicoccus sp. TaxID=1918627 RepID=UPI002E7716A9|nr:CDP-alcohol phosphatidyltransferase family protein [Frisingicoccus sp.]MEE0751240.1 CDP-alcohol phosphatidyltransferase family protein [Frisingicoccus sp.]
MTHKLNVAAAVTASRMVFAVFILFCTTFSVPFYVFYLLGAFTDVIDGRVARKLNLKSSFGAKLDMIADFIFVIAVFVKVFPLLCVPIWLWIWIASIAFIKLINLVLSLVVLHSIVSMHTVMNKVTGFMLFFLPFGIGRGSWQALTIAVIVTCFAATFAAIQEGYFIRAGKEIE